MFQDCLVDKAKQGAFEPSGREDILVTAIGRPDHPGRVRGVGRGVGLRQYFGSCTRVGQKSGGITAEMLQAIREEVRQDLRNEVRQEVKQEIQEVQSQLEEKIRLLQASIVFPHGNLNPQPSPSPIHLSTKGSNVIEEQPEEQPEDFEIPDICKLYVDVDGPKRLVAYGEVHLGSTIHHQLMGNENVKVGVQQVIEANAPVPYPTEEVKTVGQALHHFMQWPRRLVMEVSDKVSNIL